MKLSKRIKRPLFRFFLRRAYRDLLEAEFIHRANASINKELRLPFGNAAGYQHLTVHGLPSESGCITGAVVHMLKAYARPKDSLLLAGDRNSAKEAYAEITGIPPDRIFTAGLHEEMDFCWNYDDPAPAMDPVGIIVSHAMIEHITDPYSHVRNCYEKLNPGGHLIIHTVMPGFVYHRFPIDCLRFHPDWFEAVGTRLGARIAERALDGEGQIIYCFEKPY